MKKYNYPSEITEENFEKLVERSKEISSKASNTFGLAFIASIAIFIGFAALYLPYYQPYLSSVSNSQTWAWISITTAIGVSLFLALFVIERLNILLRRIFNLLFSFYPSAEEFIFAQCIITANLYAKKENWASIVRYRSMYLFEEFSRFMIYDVLNFRRKFYAKEFTSLANGQTQIGRMLLFSEGKVKELFSNFAICLVNNDDPMAYLYLQHLIKEVENYGKLEGLVGRIESQIKSWRGIVALIGAIVTIIGTIAGLFLKG
jgi:hypothetical protein